MLGKLFFLLVLYGCCDASPQDMTGKMFTLPVEGKTSYIKLHANIQQPNISAMTMCQRFFYTGPTGVRTIFSLASRSDFNAFLLSYVVEDTVTSYRLHIGGAAVNVFELPDHRNEWIATCWTYDGSTGLTLLWANGKRSAHYIIRPGSVVPKDVRIFLGQDQDNFGGGFDAKQCFVGDVTDVQFWDYVIPPCEIKLYMDGIYTPPGNVLSWQALDYTTNGDAFTVRSDRLCYRAATRM